MLPAFLSITILILIAFDLLHYHIEHQSKQKQI